MVEDAGKAPGLSALRALNIPRPVRVEVKGGSPATVIMRGVRASVALVADRWRIDDEWWRDCAVARAYVEVLLENGRRLVLFQDETDHKWYEQGYGR